MADTAIIEKLTTARVGLLLKAPFFGNMATRMRLIDASDWCPTGQLMVVTLCITRTSLPNYLLRN